jgi:hypothetical protein
LLIARPGAQHQIAARVANWLALGQLDCREKKGDLAAALTIAID